MFFLFKFCTSYAGFDKPIHFLSRPAMVGFLSISALMFLFVLKLRIEISLCKCGPM